MYVYIVWHKDPANESQYNTLLATHDTDNSITLQKREREYIDPVDAQVDGNGDYIVDGNYKIQLIDGRYPWMVTKVVKSEFEALETGGALSGLTYVKKDPEDIYSYIITNYIDIYFPDPNLM